MKRLMLLLIAVLSICSLSAQSIGYKHSGSKIDGKCSVDFYPYCYDGECFVVVCVTSAEVILPPNPTLLLRLNDDSVLKLGGWMFNTSKFQTALSADNATLPTDEVTMIAKFPISEKEVEMLREGVKKVGLDLLPMVHQHEFKKDKLGKGLYKSFTEAIKRDEEF